MEFSSVIVTGDLSETEAICQSPNPLENWRGIESKGMGPVKIATLQSLLTGQTFDEAFCEYDHAIEASDEGPWVIRLPDLLVERLAELDEYALECVAEELVATEEFERDGWPLEAVHVFLEALADLANVGLVNENALFLWVGL
ncbi:MAG: hypothetical protein ACYC2R_07040 [Burkholderiales bacterium]